MSWKDNLLDASFRDIPFSVFNSDLGVGRRTVLHQYPFQDEPFVEDMGEDAREFIVEGFIVQNIDNDFDYFSERDDLIDALSDIGSGTLVHPFHGTIEVSLTGKARVKEDFAEGGIARFTMTFVGSGVNLSPTQVIDSISEMDDGVSAMTNRSVDSFTDLVDLDNLPGFNITKMLEDAQAFMTMNTLALGTIHLTRFINSATSIVTAANSALAGIISSPCDLASGLISAFNGILFLGGLQDNNFVDKVIGTCTETIYAAQRALDNIIPSDVNSTNVLAISRAISDSLSDDATIPNNLGIKISKASLEMTRYGEELGGDNVDSSGDNIINPIGGQLPDINVTTLQLARQKKNQTHMVNLSRAGAIGTACRISVRVEYDSVDDALGVMQLLTDAIDDQLLKLGNETFDEDLDEFNVSIQDNESYIALEKLRPIVVNTMTNIGANLAEKIDFTVPNAVISSLELSYDRYGEIDRDQEINDRNRNLIIHPGFLPSQDQIEILAA